MWEQSAIHYDNALAETVNGLYKAELIGAVAKLGGVPMFLSSVRPMLTSTVLGVVS